MSNVLRLASDNGDFVELERVDNDSFDVLLAVRVLRGQFRAVSETWILREEWFSFTQQVTVLEESRRGEAQIRSISPGELSLRIRALDPAGHTGIEGVIGTTTYDSEMSLRFSVFSFDPSQLVAFVRLARKISEALGAANA